MVRRSGHRYFIFRAIQLKSLPNIFPTRLAATAGFVLWAAAAVLARDRLPWLFWATTALLPAVALLRIEASWFQTRQARLILAACAALFLIHCAWAIARVQFYDPSSPGTYWRDDHNYFNESAAIADTWAKGDYPAIWHKGSPPYLGTLHVGYHRPLATGFLIFGKTPFVGLLINALALSLLPLLAALSARYLFGDLDKEEPRQPRRSAIDVNAPPARHNTPLMAAGLVALHPNQFYWSAYLMKDAWTAFCFLATMTIMLGTIRRRSVALGLGAVFLLPYLFTVRIYASASLIFGAMLLPGLKLRRQQIFAAMFVVLGLTVILLGYTERGNALFSQMRDSLAALAPPGVRGPTDMLKQLAAGIPRLFLSPYAWLILPDPSPMYGLYPGMWYLYLVGYPLAFSGLYAAIKRNLRLAVVPITAFGVAGLIFLAAQYGGNASRQRYYLEPLILIFAAYGLKYPSKGWIIGILIAELAWIIGQVIALK